jgi:hypothetical protein
MRMYEKHKVHKGNAHKGYKESATLCPLCKSLYPLWLNTHNNFNTIQNYGKSCFYC